MSVKKMMNVFVIAVLIAWHCSGQLLPHVRSQIEESHNFVRSAVTPTATNMLRMIYNNTLEDEAKNMVKCDFNETTVKDKGDVIAGWGTEGGKYTYDKNECDGGPDACKHYKQVVWAEAMYVGCASQDCTSDGKVAMLCLYDKGPSDPNTKPYQNGQSCTMCPSGYQMCQDKLCTAGSSIQTTTSSATWISFSGGLVMMTLVIGNQFN
nr:hypothetical transcript [Hymenolepis microstoma]